MAADKLFSVHLVGIKAPEELLTVLTCSHSSLYFRVRNRNTIIFRTDISIDVIFCFILCPHPKKIKTIFG